MSEFKFNYDFLKKSATPGSWRRGYELYQKDMILEHYPEKNFYKAKVKGNFQDFYITDLIFKKNKVEARCNCPLKEEWCKHSVAVALNAMADGAFDKWNLEKNGIEPDLSDIAAPAIENPKGNYIFHFNPKRRQNFFSVLVRDRSTNKIVRSIETILRGLLEIQKNDPDFKLNDAQMAELNLFQTLLKISKQDKKAGWYDIPITKFAPVFPQLAQLEEVLDEKTKERIMFTENMWSLNLDVSTTNINGATNIVLELFWTRPDKEETYPFEEINYFSRQIKWGRYKNVIFPINIAMNELPQSIIKSTFTDLKDADGGKFVYEELPHLQEIMPVTIAENISKLLLEHKAPINIVTLGIDYDQSLKASLEFDYNGVRVPYTKSNDKSPYLSVKDTENDLVYWIKRDYQHEQTAYNMLLACKFVPMQTNNLALEKENAIDFYNYYIQQAGEGWKFEERDDMNFFKLIPEPFRMCAKIDFSEESVDSMEIQIYGQVGDEVINFDDIYETIQSGEKYARVRSLGFVEYPAQNIYQIMRSFNSFDAYRNDDNTFLVKTYRVGLITELQNQGFELVMSEKFQKFWEQISTFSTTADGVDLPKDVNAEFREYQVKGFNWLWFLYQYGLNGILADDMGLGKTLQALALLQKAKEVDGPMPTLVVAPTTVVFNWENEIEKFTPGLSCLKIQGAERKSLFKEIPDYDIVITSYALVRRDIEKLKKYKFRYVILDESQNIKNAISQTAQSVKELQSDHKLALSGTPIENKLEELWSVFDFLMPGFLFNVAEFNYRYVAPIMERQDKTVEKRLKLQIFPFILRRMKRDVAKDLPDKVENMAYCELTDEQRDFYLEVLDSTKEELFKSIELNGLEKSRMSIFSALLRLRQICCHPKLYDKEHVKGVMQSGKFEHLKGMLSQIIEEKHRVLLFSQFVDMLDIIKGWLEREGIPYEYLTGKTKDRESAVNNFNNNPNIPIFLISLKAGGTGLNLTGADYVIHYDPWWNPAVEDQATDRAYRIGQTKKVFVYRLITKNTVEEKIQKIKGRKRDLVDSVVSIDRNITKSLTMEDIKEIFSVD